MADMTIDRARLAQLHAEEERRYVELHPASAALATDARAHLLGGVPMAWMTRWPGAFPLTCVRASGARFTDADGLDYVDFCLGDTGAMTGHALPAVADAVAAQARLAVTTMLPSADAAWVAAELQRRFGLPAWQLAMTATDANRFALRLARHLTGRPKVAVMDWCYHGTVDDTLAVLDQHGAVVPRPGALGPPVDPALTTRVVPFNEIDTLARGLAHGDVACVLMEPALTNIGIVLPEPGYLDAVRRLTREHGALWIVDETHTICVGPGGATAAWGLEPDLLVIGKPIGGGVPIAAFGMSAEVAGALAVAMADDGIDVSGIGGTLTGNALSVAAARATLSSALRDEDFAAAVPLADAWADGVQRTIAAARLPWHVQRLGCRAEYWFSPPPRTGAEAAAASDHELDAFMHLWALNRGVLLTPFHNMALLSPFHTAADIDLHSEVFAGAVAALTGRR